MFVPRVRGVIPFVAVVAALFAAACGSSGSEPGGGSNNGPAALSVVSGNGQTGLVGSTLSSPLVVLVSNTSGTPLSGATVNFAVTSGAGTVAPASAVTDANGQARTNVTLGSSAGNVAITATVAGTSLTASFVVTAGTVVTSSACSSSAAQTPAAGGVLAGVAGSGICLGGGTTGADYALVTFYGNPDSSQIASLTIRSTGATALTTASLAPASDAGTFYVPPVKKPTNDIQARFDHRLRLIAQRELAPRMAAARATMRSGAAFNALPASVSLNQILTLNGNGNDACTNQINIAARVAAISNTAIVVTDTTNPSGGFTDAEYASFATTFDTLINPLDVSNFGSPTDIDKNGKIVIFFTKEVNKLTPRGSQGFIGGFFFERDLFPLVDTPTAQGCPTSNFGEMFYVLVPDPNAVFSDARTKSDVLSNTIPTLAHEYQHLINAGRRMYINNAQFFEDVWLNEGLSHIAEELAYYRVSGLTPRQNIGITAITKDTIAVNRFNQYQSDNVGRFSVFLSKPNQTSVYAGNDSLETRGATWDLLRYLADHRGTSDGDTWTSLVNTTFTGQQNLAHVFGSTYLTSIRDWATSVFSDDIAGVTDTRFLEPSWNFRSIFPQLCANSSCTTRLGKYPLTVVPLSDVAPANVSVDAGGVAYIRFTVPAGGQASIDWTSGGLPVTSLMQFSVVRSR
jgi:hypothetical protein